MKLVLSSLSFMTAVAAFAPQSSAPLAASKTALNLDMDSQWGVTVETGNKCPPLGAKMLEDSDDKALKWFQNAEIKNGRVAMVATIGYAFQKAGVHFPLYLGPPDAASDMWYLSKSADVTFDAIAHAATPFDAMAMVPAAGWAQIIAAAGAFELTAWNRQWNEDRPVPGDYGFDPLGFTKRPGGLESEELKELRIKELKNGRLAMVTMAAWLSEESIPGSFPLPHP